MVVKMPSPKSKASSSADQRLSADIHLPAFEKPMREHWPSRMSWADAVRSFAASREHYMRNFDSPEEGLRPQESRTLLLVVITAGNNTNAPDTIRIGRRWQDLGICLAPKARRHEQPGATPQGFVQRQTASAESAIHFGSNLFGTDGEPVR
jgi:hypothetical protein